MESRASSWLGVGYQDSLSLAETLFDALCQARGSQGNADTSGSHGNTETIGAAEFSKVLTAVRDCVDGAGCFVAAPACPSPHSSASSATEGDEVCREEFLRAMREVYAVVGRRAFDAALRAQTKLAARSSIARPPIPIQSAPRGGRELAAPANDVAEGGTACGGTSNGGRASTVMDVATALQDLDTTIPTNSPRGSCTPMSCAGSVVDAKAPLYQRRCGGHRTMTMTLCDESVAGVVDQDGCSSVGADYPPPTLTVHSPGGHSGERELDGLDEMLTAPRMGGRRKSWHGVPSGSAVGIGFAGDAEATSSVSHEDKAERRERRLQTITNLAQMACAAHTLPGQQPVLETAPSSPIDALAASKKRRSLERPSFRRLEQVGAAGTLPTPPSNDADGLVPFPQLSSAGVSPEEAPATGGGGLSLLPERRHSMRTPLGLLSRQPTLGTEAAAAAAASSIRSQATMSEVSSVPFGAELDTNAALGHGPADCVNSPSALSSARCSSTAESHVYRWRLPEETLIVFDWDDTICPTSFIQEDRRLRWSEEAPCFKDPTIPLLDPNASGLLLGDSGGSSGSSKAASVDNEPLTMADALRRHVEVAAATLRTASACGRVVIITLAKQGWIELSIKNFLPGLGDVIKELGIQIIYARHALPEWKIRMAAQDDLDILMLMKQVAMNRCLKRFYSGHPERSWKNVLSIGDSTTERDALTEALFLRTQLDKNLEEKPCRCKTVKLPEDPDLTQLTAECEVVTHWLQLLVSYDGDISLDLSNADDALETLEKVGRAGASLGEAEVDLAGALQRSSLLLTFGEFSCNAEDQFILDSPPARRPTTVG